MSSTASDSASKVSSSQAAPVSASDETFGAALTRLINAWDRFWFTPTRPHTLCVLRLLTGAMMLYCHLVLASDLSAFVGQDAWISNDMSRQLHDGAFGPGDWARSYLWHIDSPTLIIAHQWFTVLVTGMFMIGLATRVTVPLSLFLQLMYLHRLTGALFGLDQIVTYTTLYLSLTPCGSCFSADAFLARRWKKQRASSGFLRFMLPDDSPSVAANVGTRLLQLHLCVIYLFGGLSKARGETWWNGTAVWYAVSNYEYQSLDMTWMSRHPAIISALSNATLFWEVFYCALVWPRVTRPVVLAVAFAVHASIAMFLGMITFGTMMIFANGIFLSPRWFQTRQQREEDDARSLAVDVERTDDAKNDEQDSAAAQAKRRYRALKQREEKYEVRVRKLRAREDQIKHIVKQRRRRKRHPNNDSDSDQQTDR
jgi:hypothetical protein